MRVVYFIRVQTKHECGRFFFCRSVLLSRTRAKTRTKKTATWI